MSVNLVEAVKAHAYDHYDEGWDVVVETMTDSEIDVLLGRARTPKGAIAKVQRTVVDLWVERQANADVPEAERELALGREDMLTEAEATLDAMVNEPRVYQGLVIEDVEIFGVGVDVDADAAVLHNPLGHHLPGLACDGPVCGACTSEHNRRFATRYNRSQLRHVSVAAIRLCTQRHAEGTNSNEV